MRRLVWVDLAGGMGNSIFLFQVANYVASVNHNTILVNKSNIDKTHSGRKPSIDDFIFRKQSECLILFEFLLSFIS